LTYTWAVASKPSGAADPSFSGNGSNAAKNATATFSKVGAYQFQVTVRDADGLTASSAVSVNVVQALTSIAISPSVIKLVVSRTVQFIATASDQFGERLAVQPVFVWSKIGKGTLRQNGRYTAPAKPGGPYTILASAGGVSGIAKVTVVKSLSLARKMVVLRA
jgi:PKD repeat protein